LRVPLCLELFVAVEMLAKLKELAVLHCVEIRRRVDPGAAGTVAPQSIDAQ